jgi:hypothetical protein
VIHFKTLGGITMKEMDVTINGVVFTIRRDGARIKIIDRASKQLVSDRLTLIQIIDEAQSNDELAVFLGLEPKSASG